jgi:hypothetical protein
VAVISWNVLWAGAGWKLVRAGRSQAPAPPRPHDHTTWQAGALLGRMLGAACGLPVVPAAAAPGGPDERDGHDRRSTKR